MKSVVDKGCVLSGKRGHIVSPMADQPTTVHTSGKSKAARKSGDRLSSKRDWNRAWDLVEKGPLAFNPRAPKFRDLDDLFMRHLPQGNQIRCLEVGCCPGQYLWYFHTRFGHQPSGIDYLQERCVETRQRCEQARLDAEIIHADLFEFEYSTEHPPWDVVVSLGLVEHFEDIVPCLNRHIDLTKPGGLVAITIPNHAGMNGRVLRTVSPQLYAIHNHMNWADLRQGLESTGRVEILEGGYYGRLGFWGTAVYRKAPRLGRLPYLAVRAPLWAIEHAGRFLPNSATFSPNIAVIARRLPDKPTT
jgi:2-polyprenyl-3-methyl-5-hydroxy-6-metoxy-1,4-benzoquinol methylase